MGALPPRAVTTSPWRPSGSWPIRGRSPGRSVSSPASWSLANSGSSRCRLGCVAHQHQCRRMVANAPFTPEAAPWWRPRRICSTTTSWRASPRPVECHSREVDAVARGQVWTGRMPGNVAWSMNWGITDRGAPGHGARRPGCRRRGGGWSGIRVLGAGLPSAHGVLAAGGLVRRCRCRRITGLDGAGHHRPGRAPAERYPCVVAGDYRF